MARYTGPKAKISRKFGEPIMGPSKALQKKNYGPGMHGRGRKRKQSEYALQLIEKQKVKYTYGILERQFRAGWPGLDVVPDVVRCQDCPVRVALEQRIVHVDWLLLEHVQRSTRDLVGVDRLGQRRLVDDAAA